MHYDRCKSAPWSQHRDIPDMHCKVSWSLASILTDMWVNEGIDPFEELCLCKSKLMQDPRAPCAWGIDTILQMSSWPML